MAAILSRGDELNKFGMTRVETRHAHIRTQHVAIIVAVDVLIFQETGSFGIVYALWLKRKCHFDEIYITDCTESCHFNNFRWCNQWRKFSQNDNISAVVSQITQNLCLQN